jgi:lipoprotein LprG
MTRRLMTLALALVLGLSLTGCEGGGSSSSGKPVKERLAAAKAAFDKSPAVDLKLEADKLPSSVSGVKSAEGVGTHQPAFKGTISVSQKGLSLSLPVVAVDGKVHVKFGLWQTVDPSQYGAPDPAALMDPDSGLSTLLDVVTGLDKGKQTRAGKSVVTTVKGTVPGENVAALIPSADKSKDFAATFSLDDEDRLTSAVLTGPFYPDAGDITYRLDFSGYGSDETVSAP